MEVNFEEQINLLAEKYVSPNRSKMESLAKGSSSQSKASYIDVDLELQSANCALDLSMASTISDDSSDNDERTKELLAKWGDKKYQANLKNYSDSSNTKLKLSLSLDSSEQSSSESEPENNSSSKPSIVRPSGVVMQSAKEPMPVAENSKFNAPNVSRKNPDKSLLSSESIREIIQQDIIEKERTRNASTDKSKSGEAYGQKGIGVSHAAYEKQASSTGKGGENVNSSSMQSTYPKPDYAGKINAGQKTKLQLGVKEESKAFSKVSSRVEFVIASENEDAEVKEIQSKQHIAGESELLKKIRGLGASIREVKREKLTEGSTRLASEKGSTTSTDKQQVESNTSKSATSVLLDTEQSTYINENSKSYEKEGHGNEEETLQRSGKPEAEKQLLPQGKSQHPTPSEFKAVHPRKDVLQQEKRKTVIDKSNLNRLKGIIKGVMKEKGKEGEHGNVGRDVVGVEPNELGTIDVTKGRESAGKGIGINQDSHSVDNFDVNEKKIEVTPKEGFGTEGMQKDSLQKKSVGNSSRVEGGLPQESRREFDCEERLVRTTTLQKKTRKSLKRGSSADNENRAEGITRVEDPSENQSLEASALKQRTSVGIADTTETKAVETRKKAKMQRNENEKRQNNETSSSAKGDVIGGILRRSSMTKSIDERVSIGNENRLFYQVTFYEAFASRDVTKGNHLAIASVWEWHSKLRKKSSLLTCVYVHVFTN